MPTRWSIHSISRRAIRWRYPPPHQPLLSREHGVSKMPVRAPFYAVKLEGVDITSWISSVSVVEDDRQADSVTLTIPDPRMIYADALFEGSTVEVDAGYAEKGQHA